EPQALARRGRLAHRDLAPPRALLDEARAEPKLPERAPAPLRAGEQPVDQELERALELLAGNRLGEIEVLAQADPERARLERRVEAARELARAQTRAAEAVGDVSLRERPELAE